MSRGPILALASLLVLGAVFALMAPGARAEDEEGLDDVSAKVKAQMEKIVELMRKNEKALLELSTGHAAEPTAVDVEVPPPEGGASSSSGQGTAATGPEEGRAGGAAGAAGEDARKRLEELIQGQRRTGGEIPGELEELVRMVPQ